MKKHLLLLLIIAVIGGAVPVLAATGLEDKQKVAENEYLVLYFNETDTSIAVECKQTGKVWLSNPVGVTQSAQKSQINLVHDPGRVTKDNATYSNAYERYWVTPIENGVRVDYQFVERWTANDYIPAMVDQDRFDELVFSKLSAGDYNTLRSYFYLIKLRKMEEGEEHPEIMGLPSDDIFGEYILELLDEDFVEMQAELERLLQEMEELEREISQAGETEELLSRKKKLQSSIDRLNQDIFWELEDVTWHLVNTIVNNRADMSRIEDVTPADMEQLVDNPTYLRKNVPRTAVNRLKDIVENVGYTPLQATDDHIDNNINPTVPNLEVFKVAVEYRLDGDSFVVTIPVEDIEYPVDVEDFSGVKHTYPITFVEVLPYFSAAGLEDEGYILIPDGSGALIYLNNGKIWTSTYNQGTYGRDNAEDPLAYVTTYGKSIHMPVFGLKKGDQAYLGIIERGDAIAHFRADISGKRDNFNRIFPRFNIVKSGTISLEHGGTLDVYQPEIYKGDIRIRYLFFTGEDADYSGMARRYQEYLLDRGLLRKATEEKPPFLVEVIGAFPRIEVHWGIPRNVAYPATTFAEAKEIYDGLRDMGIANIHLRLNGWLKGGIEHIYPEKAVVEKNLGKEAELNDFIQYVRSMGDVVYPDVGFLNLYRNGLFDGFVATRDASRRLNRLPAQINPYNPATFAADSTVTAYIVSPRILPGLVKSFFSDFKRFGSNGVSLAQIGSQLNSDFNRSAGKSVDRQQAEEITVDLLRDISRDYKIMVEKGNFYTWPYADVIIGMPVEDSSYDLVDTRIPFFQMVVSGYLTYAGDPINQIADRRSYMLMSLEAGALPYFIVAGVESQAIKGTRYDKFLSFNFNDWKDIIAEFYTEYYPVYEKIYGQSLIEHEILDDGVTRSTFANGVSIIINHNRYPVEYEGMAIAAQGYCLQEEDR